LPKFSALRGRGLEVLGTLCGGELQDLRGQLHPQEMGQKVEGGAAIGAGELDDFGGIVRSALCVGRTGLQEGLVDRSRRHFHLLDAFLCPDHVLLGERIENTRHRKERHRRALLVGAGFRIGIRFLRIGLIHASLSFQSKLNSTEEIPPSWNGPAPRPIWLTVAEAYVRFLTLTPDSFCGANARSDEEWQ